MKIRTGFVSNSSSSSFMLLGIAIDNEDLYEKVKNIIHTSSKLQRSCDEYYGGDWEAYIGDESLGYLVEDALTDSGINLSVEGNYYDDMKYIGLPPQSIKDGETLLEFKEGICKSLSEIGIEANTKALEWHSDCWFDG